MTDFHMIYVTCGNEAEAGRIAEAVVGERLAACANILGAMVSVFWWDGQVRREPEVAVIFKTRADLVPPLTDRIKALHGYRVPCVVAVPIVAANPDYLAWLGAETAPPSSSA